MNEIFEQFQEFRKILCVCPHCSDLIRVSDLRLKLNGPAPRTWLDDYDKISLTLDKKEERFDKREEKLREIAREKGRKQAEKVFNKAIMPSFKALRLDPFDVKPILNPIDFVVFKGMNKEQSINDIIFLSKVYNVSSLNMLRQQIAQVISKNRYEWQVARINESGNIVFE